MTTFEQIVSEIRANFQNVDLGKIDGKLAIQINLTGEGGGTFYVEVKDNVLSVEPYEYNDRDVALTLSVNNFFKIIHGKLDPVLAFTLGKLKAEGDLGKALVIKKLIKNSR